MALKGTTIKEAIARWQEKYPDQNIEEAEEIGFQFQWPPIDKMDSSLSQLTNCKKLSLSTNMIDKVGGLNGLKHLKILGLSRNYIKNFAGFEPVSDTLEQLWVSYNSIEKLKGVGVLKKLKILYISQNLVKDWNEFNKLQELPALEELQFCGNPLYENMDEDAFKASAIKRLPKLKKLEGETIVRPEEEE